MFGVNVGADLSVLVQGKSAMGMYKQFEKGRDEGDFTMLPELHVILSGMKVDFQSVHFPNPAMAACACEAF